MDLTSETLVPFSRKHHGSGAIKTIQLFCPATYRDLVETAIERTQPIDWTRTTSTDGSRDAIQVLLEDSQCQSFMDAMQTLFASDETWRLILSDVEAVLPRTETDPDAVESSNEKKGSSTLAVREALFEEVMGNSRLTVDYLVLTMLSAVVAAIGLNEDNIAVLIGAMVIAPLLGPILGFSLASALGSARAMLQAARTAVCGLIVGFSTVYLLTLVLTVNLDSQELAARTDISPEIVALALASGAAAALSITGGLSSSLVGVMVAVALLPPSAAAAMYLGEGDLQNGLAALIVVALNIICVLLSTQIVFAWKGIRPRRWLQQKSAARSFRVNLIVWACLLIALFAVGLWLSSPAELGF
ncbi:MAG: TIGR00341 family protein [Pseudomonadota bacterium]